MDKKPQKVVLPNQAPTDTSAEAMAEALRSSFIIIKIAMVFLVGVFLTSGIRIVSPQERAIVLRFGKSVGEGEKALRKPGLLWAFPYPIDEVVKIPITELQHVTSTIGWYAVTPEQEISGNEPPPGPTLNPAADGYLLTGDPEPNIVHVRVRLYYRVSDPVTYQFEFANASNVVLNALNNALVHAAAKFSVDDVLYRNVAGFKEEITRNVIEKLASYSVGVEVDHCEVLNAIPPRQVASAFHKVTMARETRTKLINEAQSYANQVISTAEAQAAIITNEAAIYKATMVKSLAGDAKRFLDLLPKYQANPQLFMEAQFLETIGRVLTNLQDKIFVSIRPDGKPREFRLLLNREPLKPKPQTSK